MRITRPLSIAVIATAACATSPATAGLVPTRADIAATLARELHSLCEEVERDGCFLDSSAVSVAELRCSPESGGVARCRYSVKVRSPAGWGEWASRTARFRFDSNRRIWTLIEVI